MTTSEKSGLPNVTQAAATSAGRYAFIDVLRGLAALLVVFQHGGESVGWFSVTTGIGREVNFGQAGVLTFFLVSGFVIPLSLERANSLGKFWKHRAFRIYPLYLTVFVLEFLRCVTGHGSFSLSAVPNLGLFFLSHLFFLQDYVFRPNFVGASWTLAMEFIWYIALSAAFVIRANRRSVLLTVITVVGLLALALTSYVLHRQIPLGRCGIMATCVVGLMFYRLHTNEISFRTFVILVGSIVGAIVVGLYVGFGVFDRADVATVRSVLTSWGIAYLLFIVCYVARKQSVMRIKPLLALGTISYSVYLLHPLVEDLIDAANVHGAAFMALLFPITIGLAFLTYRYIEKPGIEYPRRGEKRKQERLEIQARSLAND